ncbi:hypothetical protein V490_09059, partial [Pseudogymnoascus sp. VKM F-3557]
EDDVFGDGGSGGSWVGWLARILTTLLTLLTLTNAAYTFLRKRHYRLFETPLSAQPSTPSASLVRVSSPPSSSPMRLLSHLLPAPASSRAHPDPTTDVWELAVWDPLPLALEVTGSTSATERPNGHARPELHAKRERRARNPERGPKRI